MNHNSSLSRRLSSSETLQCDDTTTALSRTTDLDEKNIENNVPILETLPQQELVVETFLEGSDERAGSKQVIRLSPSDPEHPNNWSVTKKALVLVCGITTVLHSTLGSSLPSNAIEYIARDFNVTSQLQLVLPISCFLLGYVPAPILCGPLSENYGRKPVMLISFFLFNIFTMACAVAPSWASLLLFRFCCGLFGSAPIACVSGLFADINSDPRKRGQSMAVFMVATTIGPVIAPPVSGFIAQNTTWRWVFGFGAIFAGSTLPCVILLPETYAPVLLTQKAARMRKETGNENIIAQSDLQKKDFNYVVKVVMTRPFRMLCREMIVSTTCAYLALCYGIFYLYFAAYPIIFLGPDSIHEFSPGIAGLIFIPIGIGGCIAGVVFLLWDEFLARAQARKAPWSQREEFRRLPLALIGGPMYAASIFWLGWSARPNVSWAAPAASGITFGMGFMLIFMAMLNYLSDAYLTFAASAQGIASTCRSLLGVLLPFAAHRMFQQLGVGWACSVLGFLSLALGMVPFMFIKFGEKIRENSKFCQELRALHEKELEEKERHERSIS